jgi:very-short-patch-repair endonuclease
MQGRKPPLPTVTKQRAKSLRRNGTDAEARLWYHLRAGRLNGFKFRRQHPVPPYIVDFYCAAAKLIVELDGSQHTRESDAERSRYLDSLGLRVLRYWDNEVLQHTEVVMAAILSAAEEQTLAPNPSPGGRGE